MSAVKKNKLMLVSGNRNFVIKTGLIRVILCYNITKSKSDNQSTTFFQKFQNNIDYNGAIGTPILLI